MCLRLIFLSFFAITLFHHAHTQGIYPGDKWPDLEFKEVRNYHHPTLLLSDFKGKALLLSFWSHSCAPCIEAFPHLDSMQEIFKDRLQIIHVNPENADSTRNFFQRKNKLPQPKIVPMAMGQKELAKTVNVLGDLWFDSTRIFRFATESQNVTEENMKMFLNGIPLPFKKRLKLKEFDTDVPLIVEGGGRWMDSIGFYSYFFHQAFEIPQLHHMEPARGGPVNQLRLIGIVPELYRLAFNEFDKYEFTKFTTEIRVKDSSLFFPSKNDIETYVNWVNEHIYTYDSKVPLSFAGDLYKLMQKNLPFRFGAKAEVQLLERDCWVLETLDSLVFKSQAGSPYSSQGSVWKNPDSLVRFQHWPADQVFSSIKEIWVKFSPLPLINQLNYSGPMNVSMHLNVLLSGRIDLFKDELRKNGLQIREQKMKVPVLVITD